MGDHAENALGTIMDGGEDGRVGCNALADERARGNDALDSLGEGDAGASVAGKGLEGSEIGREGVIPVCFPVHSIPPCREAAPHFWYQLRKESYDWISTSLLDILFLNSPEWFDKWGNYIPL
jgi:hypothetical protein